MTLKNLFLASAALAFLVGGVGCSNTKESAERTSLISQNDDLKRQLDAERAARQASDARANAATDKAASPSEVTTPGMDGGPLDLSSAPPLRPAGRGTRTTPAPTNLGPDVTSSKNSLGEDVLEIKGDVLFDSGKATLKTSATKTLNSIATTLKSKYAGQEIRIEGYTDPAPVKNSGWDDNYDLGSARANKVRIFLEGKGVKNMYIASFGPTKLKSTKNMALNRRVDIVVVRSGK